MKIQIFTEYRDKSTGTIVTVGSIIEVDEKKQESLRNAGIMFEESSEDLTIKSNDLTSENDELNKKVNDLTSENDELLDIILKSGAVDDLKSDDLKLLCNISDIEYMNVETAKADLKALAE